jgi:hypothetical protein
MPYHTACAGQISPVTQIADNEARSTERWNEMPDITSVNPVHSVKPGATVLLTAADKQKQDQIVLAWQRYGRGKAVAMPIQDSWLWRMDAKVPVEDTTHATTGAACVGRRRRAGSGERQHEPDRVEPGEAVKIIAEVNDAARGSQRQPRRDRHLAVGEEIGAPDGVDDLARRRIQGEPRPTSPVSTT